MKIRIQPGLDHITDRADLLQDFVVFVCKDLECMPCPIDIVNGREGSGLKTTAQYDTQNQHVMVNAKNRHFGDVLRSIAHELVHHKQNVKGELSGPTQDIGGHIEDEANARAGALLKSFAYRKGPERIYEGAELISDYVRALITEETPSGGTGSPGLDAVNRLGKFVTGLKPEPRTPAQVRSSMVPSGAESGDGAGCDTDYLEKSGFRPLTDNSGGLDNPAPGSKGSSPYGPRKSPIEVDEIRKDTSLSPRDKRKKIKNLKPKMHKGFDIANVSGTPIESPVFGVVKHVKRSTGDLHINFNYNGKPHQLVFRHMMMISVSPGACVSPGEVVGAMGNLGRSKGPHLHIETWKSARKSDFRKTAPGGGWKVFDPAEIFTNLPKRGKLDPDTIAALKAADRDRAAEDRRVKRVANPFPRLRDIAPDMPSVKDDFKDAIEFTDDDGNVFKIGEVGAYIAKSKRYINPEHSKGRKTLRVLLKLAKEAKNNDVITRLNQYYKK